MAGVDRSVEVTTLVEELPGPVAAGEQNPR
jgi:hypothetical protein